MILHRLRLATIGFALLPSAGAAAAEDGYFPEALLTEERPCAEFPDRSRPALTEFLSGLFSGELGSIDEPVLHSTVDAEVIRLLWLSASTGGAMVRVDDLSSPNPRLTAILFRQFYYTDTRGLVDRRVERELTGEEADRLRSALAAAQLFTPPRNFCRFGLDGDEWMIEQVEEGRYHFVEQFSPEGGPVRHVGGLLLGLVSGATGAQEPGDDEERMEPGDADTIDLDKEAAPPSVDLAMTGEVAFRAAPATPDVREQ